MAEQILVALKVTSFFFAMYYSVIIFFRLYVVFIQQLGEIYLNKKYKISISGWTIAWIPILWSIFYFFCTVKG